MSAAALTCVPRRYRVEYRPQGGLPRAVEVGECDSFVTQDLSLLVQFDGETLSFEAEALEPVRIDSLTVELSHAFASDEQVLLNGYQSWTTTEWLPASSGMRGLDSVPRVVIDRWALDRIGDYRFTEYGRSRGQQHGYTYGVLRRGDSHLLLGSLDERSGFTVIRTDARDGSVLVQRECPNRLLEPGHPVTLGSIALIAGDEDAVYDRWFELSGVKARPARPLVGYSSWYRHYGDIDRDKLASDLAGAQEAFRSIDTGSAIRLFQVDDGFCRVGDWLDVDAAKFPGGLSPVAREIRAAGFLPGLWMAPFVCEAESRVYAEHPDWLLRDEAGDPVRTGFQWSGPYALNTRHADARAYVRDALRTAVHEWGFGLLKLDFLYAACLVPHDGLNRGELMADAMQLLREAAGEECLLLGCGVPLGSAFGVADYCRIGCDVGPDWDGKPHIRLLHRERVSTKNSLGNTIARAPLDGRAFGNDPDVFFLRDDVRLSPKQRRLLLDTDARCGSMLLTSDDMGKWGTGDRGLFLAALGTLLERKG